MSKTKDIVKKALVKKTVKAEAIEKIKETIAVEKPEVKKKTESLFFTWDNLKDSTKEAVKNLKISDSKIGARIGYIIENQPVSMSEVTRECGDSCYSMFKRLEDIGIASRAGRLLSIKVKIDNKDTKKLEIIAPKAILDANSKINSKQAKLLAEIEKKKK